MTSGEAQLRFDIYKALDAVNAIGDPDQIAGYIDAVVEAVKKQWIYVTCGEILEVTWDNIFDTYDDSMGYTLKAESTYEEDDEDWDEEDD